MPDGYVAIIINAVFTGGGVTIGTYLSNKYIIEHFKKINKGGEDGTSVNKLIEIREHK